MHPDPLHSDKISALLRTQWLGHELLYLPETASTNTYAKSLPKDVIHHGTLVITDDQTSGRGQYERTWTSRKCMNLTFSMIFEPRKAEGYTLLSLACALSVVQLLEEKGIASRIKWPNDVLTDKGKIAGILTETQYSGNRLKRLVIGIGLNVNQNTFPADTEAASLCMLTNEDHSREELLCNLLSRIEYNYQLWTRCGKDFLCSINRNLEGHGEWVRLVSDGREVPGSFKLIGVDEKGALRTLDRDMNVQIYDHEQVRILKGTEA